MSHRAQLEPLCYHVGNRVSTLILSTQSSSPFVPCFQHISVVLTMQQPQEQRQLARVAILQKEQRKLLFCYLHGLALSLKLKCSGAITAPCSLDIPALVTSLQPGPYYEQL
ncbi:hypothetical protein AAY473_010233 [Plecturocebus cupreus]